MLAFVLSVVWMVLVLVFWFREMPLYCLVFVNIVSFDMTRRRVCVLRQGIVGRDRLGV